MTENTRETLLSTIEELLEMPGVAIEDEIPSILTYCKDLSVDDLCAIAARLRIRQGSLLNIATSSALRKEMRSASEAATAIMKKYDI